MNNRLENYKHITVDEMTTEDTFFMKKTHNGFSYSFTLQFVKFEKGIMYGKVIDLIQPNNLKSIWIGKNLIAQGSEVSGRISSCYLFGKKCYWFKKQGKTWGVSEYEHRPF